MADNIIRPIPYVGFGSWQQPVATATDLPPFGNDVGDIRVAQDTGDIYEWNGTAWVLVAGPSGAIGIISINGLTASSQFLVTGTSGTDFNIASIGATHTFNIPNASAINRGLLTPADWSTFNNKQPAGNYITALTGDATATGPGSVPITLATVNSSPGTYNFATLTVNAKGLVTSATSGSAITSINGNTLTAQSIVAGTGISVVSSVGTTTITNTSPSSGGTVTSVSQTTNSISGLTVTGSPITTSGTLALTLAQSTTSTNGYLSSTDWNIFNNKQPAGNYITALTGDVTATGPGSAAATLATVNGNVGSFGSSTSIPSFTVNAKGLITAASGNVVIAPAGTLTGTTLASNVVSSSLTSVGTITSGTWNGTIITVPFGGTGLSTLTANNVILGNGTSSPTFVAPGTSGNLLTSNGTTWTSAAPATSGTVTSVALTMPAIFSVAGSPITSSGTFAVTLATETANTVWAGPASGAAATPTFRTLTQADLPYPTVVTKLANYTLLTTDNNTRFLLDTSGGTFNLTLLSASSATSGYGFYLVDKKGTFSTNNLTLVPNGTDLIEGLNANKVFQTSWGGWYIFTDGTSWFVV